MWQALSRIMHRGRAFQPAPAGGGRAYCRGTVRMAATACSTDPVAAVEWPGLRSWRSFVDERRGLDTEGKITAQVLPHC